MFVLYSAMGFLIETAFALVRTGRLENRKTMVLLPLCPVYGLGASAIVLFLSAFPRWPLTIAAGGMLVGTAVEYGYAYVCERVFRVRLWDYSGLAGSRQGRVNVFYSAAWGALSVVLVLGVQPLMLRAIAWIPAWLVWAMGAAAALDSVVTWAALYRFGHAAGEKAGAGEDRPAAHAAEDSTHETRQTHGPVADLPDSAARMRSCPVVRRLPANPDPA